MNPGAPGTGPADAAKACVNCGAVAAGAYCPACGQETDVRLPTLRQFMRDATGSLVALDGRLWRTLRALIMQPGFLVREYFRGRRRYYVRPARLFLVTSLILFAVLRFTTEPIRFDETGASAKGNPQAAAPDSSAAMEKSEITLGGGLTIGVDRNFRFSVNGPRNVLTDQLRARLEHFNALPTHDKGRQLSSMLLQWGPYAMFALLPVFAWLQQISYLGRLRAYPGRPKRYVEHLVYATYMHSVMFLAAIVALLIPWAWPRWLILAWVVVYVLRSKHEIYGGSRWGGIVRTLFVVVAYTAFMTVALVLLIFPAILLA